MALIKCPKCGSMIPENSQFCLKCGTKISNSDKLTQDSSIDELLADINGLLKEPDSTPKPHNSPKKAQGKKKKNHTIAIVIGIIVVLFILYSVFNAYQESITCSYNGCGKPEMEGSEYCRDHTCTYDGCRQFKPPYDSYCYYHSELYCCAEDDCDNPKIDGGEYCTSHTCKYDGCYNKKSSDTDFCLDHRNSMRDKLTDPSFSFNLNSAGGINFRFKAHNSTGKDIKYVRFQVTLYNAVGDLVLETIKHSHYCNVEIIGPIEANSNVFLPETIIGYCEKCARIDIENITIVYADGSSETGGFNYYYEK